MALISEKKFMINPANGNVFGGDHQANYYSQTSLLSNRIEFKSSKEHSSDESSEEDISIKLKSKYHVLLPDTSPEKVKQFYTNGTIPLSKTKAAHIIAQEQNKDGDELGIPKQILYPREKILLEWKKFGKIGSGLANLGNTCFMNSVLQCLTYCPPLANYLFSIKEEHQKKCRLNFCMVCLMTKHVSLALSHNISVVKPVYICQRMKSIAKHFTFGRQEDSHEFLRYVIDHMWRSCLSIHEQDMGLAGTASKFDHLTKSTTAINQIFGGYHRSQILCSQCKEKSNTYDYFMDFMLDIQNVSSLEEALQKHVTPEILRNENAYKCSKCKKCVMAKKQFTVHRAPNVATFQFKRFDCSRMFGKITKPVSYPEKLNIRPYMSEKGPPIVYKLISVLVHLGSSSNSGHYYCYVRNSNNCWYLMDDSHVAQVSLGEVLNQKAYVLFYIRLPMDGVQQNLGKNPILSSQVNVNIQQKLTTEKTDNASQLPNQSKYFNSNFKFLQNSPKDDRANINSTQNTDFGKNNVNMKNSMKTDSHLNTLNSTKKVLVPYDKDSDDEDSTNDNDKVSQKENLFNDSDSRISSNNLQNTSAQGKSNSSVISNQFKSKDSTRDNEPLPIPILKVKATTNSWQVVESTPSVKIVGENKVASKTQSNWRISKSIDTSSQGEMSVNNGNSVNLKDHPKTSFVKTEFKEERTCVEGSEKIKKRKDKKKKKDKEKPKKRDRQISELDGDTEFKWVERTKETLELETGNFDTSNEKRKSNIFDSDAEARKKIKLSDESPKKPDILDALLKNASHGYGGNVKSWDGGVSNLNKAISEDHNFSSHHSDDEYNEEFDQGKIKKIKKVDQVDLFRNSLIKNNPFQRAHQNKHLNMNNSHDNSFTRNSSIKSSKFGKHKSHTKFANESPYKERHFDKHNSDKFAYDKNSNHYSHHHHHRTNSNSHKMKSKFKHR